MTTPEIQLPSEVIRKWQEIVDLLAEIMHVPSALVMKVEPPNITVFVSSESKGNPYEQDEVSSLNTGLYCETVMKTRQPLLVPDALLEEEWKSNPDIKLGMISYLGYPIAWPDGHIFGTICVLDNKRNEYSEPYRKLLLQFREVLQTDLRWLTELGGELATQKAHLKRAEAKLFQDEEELRRMTDAIPQTIIVLNPDGRAIYVNRVALEYTGLSLDEVRADDFRARVFHPDDVQRLREERHKALSSSVPFENEQRALGKDGKYRWFLIRYNPLLDESGKVIRWYATGTDIDDRKRDEDRTRNENVALREQIDRDSMFEDIVGSSEALRKVLRQVGKVAHSDSTVLILGETGTGKELVARAIHKRSNRGERAFIGVNCAAIPPSLIASELFGHEKGAFTGATQRRMGRFESANGGTIFLDEVGDLPAEIQIALLRVLQEREIERVGSSRPIPVDVRVVAATHRDLDALVAEGKFRQDLLYRLNVVPIQMPPLRERVADIPLLVEYFIDRFGKRAGKKFRTIDKKFLNVVQAYSWPGNVRELQNIIERAVILGDGDTLAVDETWLQGKAANPVRARALDLALVRQEKEMIEAALAESQGRVSGPAGAAAKLGVPAQTLDSKIKRLKIKNNRFKAPRAH
jgi:PAS domain S-box-containing protein